MKSICPLMTHEYKMNLFDSYEFFDINELDLINENTYDILKELNDKYNIFIFSIGRARNISLKSLYFDYKIPFIKNYIFYRNSNCEPNKSIVDARGGIFIDDMPSNLDSSSASYKLLFGEECEWSKSDKYKRVVNWTDIGNLLL
jgi:5'(3')-deoxyribonucleotidase